MITALLREFEIWKIQYNLITFVWFLDWFAVVNELWYNKKLYKNYLDNPYFTLTRLSVYFILAFMSQLSFWGFFLEVVVMHCTEYVCGSFIWSWILKWSFGLWQFNVERYKMERCNLGNFEGFKNFKAFVVFSRFTVTLPITF